MIDGINWNSPTAPKSFNGGMSYAWSPQLQLWVMITGVADTYKVLTSTNGVDWTIRTGQTGIWSHMVQSLESGMVVAKRAEINILGKCVNCDGNIWPEPLQTNHPQAWKCHCGSAKLPPPPPAPTVIHSDWDAYGC